MSGTVKLTVGGDTITCSPRYGYEIPNESKITNRRTLGGTLYTYIWYSSETYSLTLNNISATDAALIETWRKAGSDITYIPDFDVAPSTTKTVRITDTANPMRMMNTGGFNTTAVYEGTVTLKKTTAD